MNKKDLQKLKVQLYGAASRRTGTPLEFYEVPASVIAIHEQRAAEEKQRKQEAKAKLNPTRGEVSLERLTRRSVGDF